MLAALHLLDFIKNVSAQLRIREIHLHFALPHPSY